MRVAILFTDIGFENFFAMEMPAEEMLYEQFLKTILAASGMPSDQQYNVAINGRIWTKDEIVKAGGTLKALSLKKDDMMVFTQQATASSSLAYTKLEITGDTTANLLLSIIIAKSPQQAEFEKIVLTQAKEMFGKFAAILRQPQIKEGIRQSMPLLIDVYEKNNTDFGAFLITFRNYMIDRLAESTISGNSVQIQKKVEGILRNHTLDNVPAYNGPPLREDQRFYLDTVITDVRAEVETQKVLDRQAVLLDKKNQRPSIRFIKMNDGAFAPSYGSDSAAGANLYAAENFIIPSKGMVFVSTQIVVILPKGCFACIAPQEELTASNIHVRADLFHSEYCGELKVLLFNHGDLDFNGIKGDRIAQFICERMAHIDYVQVGSPSQADVSFTSPPSTSY